MISESTPPATAAPTPPPPWCLAPVPSPTIHRQTDRVADSVPSAVPVQARRRKTISRRIGQNGTLEVRDGAYRGRWLEDVPGQARRVKRSAVLGFVKQMRKS